MGAATPPLEISMDTGAQKHPHKIEALLCWVSSSITMTHLTHGPA